MARRSLRIGLLGLSLLCGSGAGSIPARAATSGGSPAATLTSSEVATLVGRMARRSYRLGGRLTDPVMGRLMLAFDRSIGDGSIQGDALLLTSDRHVIDHATVTGHWEAGHVPGGSDCQLDLAMPGRSLVLDGVCAPDVISGAIRTRPAPAGWLVRQIFQDQDATQGGRYWLTTASFYE